MIRLTVRLLPLLALALGVSGCVAYPAGSGYGGYSGYGYAPYTYDPAVAIAIPCCVYGGGSGYRHGWN